MNLNKRIEIKKENKIFYIIAIIHFIISFFLDRFIFEINIFTLDINNRNYLKLFIIGKIVSLILYIFIWQFIGKIIFKLIRKDKETITKVKYFLIYFFINMILLLLTWPGIWRWDEFKILYYVSFRMLEYWQNYLTSIFYMLSYMIIPIPSGVIIMQMVIASMVVSYIMYNFSKMIKNTKLIYLLYIPFLLLPVLDHNLYPLRLTLYSYMEVLLICQIIFIKKLGMKEKKDFLLLTIILIILCTLRTEGKIFMFLVPIIYLFVLKNEIKSIKLRIFYIIFIITISVALIISQDSIYQKKYSNRYEVTSYVNQLYVVVKEELKNNPDSEELKIISKAIDINELMRYTRGIYAHNTDRIYLQNATKEDYKNLKKAYNRLFLKYPIQVIKERIDIFLKTSGWVDDYNVHVDDTRKIYERPANIALKFFKIKYRKSNITN